jgi:chemotaxis protein CheZ
MTEVSVVENERLTMARELVALLEAGKDAKADLKIDELSNAGDNELFQEVGRLTRELHEAINGFILDSSIGDLTETDIPDASERLQYVITMTSNSANRTLSAVEASMPLLENLEKHSEQLTEEWGKFTSRQLSRDEFTALSAQIGTFLHSVTDDSKKLHENMSEVLMAQDFQDLTGQIISKVIDLVHNVEEKLIGLIRISGGKQPAHKKEHGKEILEGPVVPGVEQGDVVNSQDEVDDLLSSLGF